ncbi:hypothetical protein PMI31_04629 [Pseudomonas sp. GM55]|nr:hypothetical protein PMI31_04629 [Pseudomonas sp. GM55]
MSTLEMVRTRVLIRVDNCLDMDLNRRKPGAGTITDIDESAARRDLAEEEVKRARAGHWPTLDFIAGYTGGESQSLSELNQRVSIRLVSSCEGKRRQPGLLERFLLRACCLQLLMGFTETVDALDHLRRPIEGRTIIQHRLAEDRINVGQLLDACGTVQQGECARRTGGYGWPSKKA